jgi:hypothetical protein
MESYISPLNYGIFIILYITCFIYIYTKYSELVGFGALTVVQLAFTLFIGKELSHILSKYSGTSYRLNLASMLTLYGTIFNMILLTIALILTALTILHVQEKHNNIKGTPVILSTTYQHLYNSIKRNTIIIISLTALVLIMYYFNNESINVPIMSIISNISIHSIINNIPAITSTLLSITTLVLSSYQVKYASEFSNLKIHNTVGQ